VVPLFRISVPEQIKDGATRPDEGCGSSFVLESLLAKRIHDFTTMPGDCRFRDCNVDVLCQRGHLCRESEQARRADEDGYVTDRALPERGQHAKSGITVGHGWILTNCPAKSISRVHESLIVSASGSKR
jgi:hypothetical protein